MTPEVEKALENIKNRMENGEVIEALKELKPLDASQKWGFQSRIRNWIGQWNTNIIAQGDGATSTADLRQERNSIIKAVNDFIETLPPEVEIKPEPKPTPPVPPPPTVSTTGIPKIVILYDVADQEEAALLSKQLNILKITKQATIFNQVKDTVGLGDADQAVRNEMASAKLILALLSSNFFEGSAYALASEIQPNDNRLVPILLKSVTFDGTGLEKRRGLPSNQRFIYSEWPSADAAFKDIVDNIKIAITRK